MTVQCRGSARLRDGAATDWGTSGESARRYTARGAHSRTRCYNAAQHKNNIINRTVQAVVTVTHAF